MKGLDRERGREIVRRLAGVRVLVAGDLMLDRFLWGDASRISPEAPVPVFRVESESAVPGGAGNVVENLAVLGARVEVVGVVGDDGYAAELTGLLSRDGVSCQGIEAVPGRVTTVKTRLIARGQQLIRADREADGLPLAARVEKALQRRIGERIGRAQALILSDYDKGTLTPGLVSFCIEQARRAGIPLAADPKPRHFLDYRGGATVITPNRHEVHCFLGDPAPRSEADYQTAGRRILRRLGCRAVLITRGGEGMSLVERGRPALTIPATAREVYDVTGAGDTVIAWLTAGLAAGASLAEAAVVANVAAGVAVGKVGTTPVRPDEVLELL